MNIQFDFWDFTKSAWSLATGILAVFFLALLRSPVDTSTLILTLGLSLGVLSFWAIYALKIYLQLRNLAFFAKEAREAMASSEARVQDGLPSQQVPFPYAGPELMPSYEPISQRMRPLSGRALPIKGLVNRDQWNHP